MLVAFISQVKCVRRILPSSVACPALLYFSHYVTNRTIFEKKKKVIEHKICVLIFSTTFVRNRFHAERDKIVNLYGSSSELPVILIMF